jgi:hypothetical protein
MVRHVLRRFQGATILQEYGMRNHMVKKTSFTKIFSLLISFSLGISFLGLSVGIPA